MYHIMANAALADLSTCQRHKAEVSLDLEDFPALLFICVTFDICHENDKYNIKSMQINVS